MPPKEELVVPAEAVLVEPVEHQRVVEMTAAAVVAEVQEHPVDGQLKVRIPARPGHTIRMMTMTTMMMMSRDHRSAPLVTVRSVPGECLRQTGYRPVAMRSVRNHNQDRVAVEQQRRHQLPAQVALRGDLRKRMMRKQRSAVVRARVLAIRAIVATTAREFRCPTNEITIQVKCMILIRRSERRRLNRRKPRRTLQRVQ